MKKFVEKSTFLKLFMIFISEWICYFITITSLISYDNNSIYLSSINIIQILYFLPILFVSLYAFFNPKDSRSIFINSTIGLIIYSVILHIFINPIASLFSNIPGIINFVEYASKIYFICIPLTGTRILIIKKENIKKSYFLIFFRIILLFVITLILKKLFELKGVLYSWPIYEFLLFISLIILQKKR